MTEPVVAADSDGVRTLTLNRPESLTGPAGRPAQRER
jgi:hypothetical protein